MPGKEHTGYTEKGNARQVKVERVGPVTIYKRRRDYWIYYREKGQTIRSPSTSVIGLRSPLARSRSTFSRYDGNDFTRDFTVKTTPARESSLWTLRSIRFRAAAYGDRHAAYAVRSLLGSGDLRAFGIG